MCRITRRVHFYCGHFAGTKIIVCNEACPSKGYDPSKCPRRDKDYSLDLRHKNVYKRGGYCPYCEKEVGEKGDPDYARPGPRRCGGK